MIDNNTKEIHNILEKICGKRIQSVLGEPFTKAFKSFNHLEDDVVIAASYTCSLFLSAIKNNFPKEKFHTFVHCMQENYGRFSFDCKMYDRIIEKMGDNAIGKVTLLDEDCNANETRCSRDDITEALDFYTNR
jgi:hypothetical protein